MGTSNWHNIPWCVQAIMKIQPKRVVDIGVGFGRWGMTLREFGEVWFDRVLPHEWEIDIEGVEAFEGSIADYHRQFYNRIYVGDALEVLPGLEGNWTLAILGDVLEHFYKSDGERVLADLVERADYVMVNLPLGEDWPQEDMYDNPYEEHKAVWELSDFDSSLVVAQQTFLDFEERPFASIVLSRQDPRSLRLGLFGSDGQGAVGGGAAPSTAFAPAQLDLGDKDLLSRVCERVEALESIRASGAWRAVNQARNNPLVWRLGKTLRRASGDAISIRNLDGAPLYVTRVESDDASVLWDFLRKSGNWEAEANNDAAFGEALVSATAGDAIHFFAYGATIRIGLRGGKDAGRCRITVGKEKFDLELTRNRATPLVFDVVERVLLDENERVPLVAETSTVVEAGLSSGDQVLSEQIQGDADRCVAVYPPGWTGIGNSTKALFRVHAPLPERLTTASRDRFLALIEDSGCESLVLSGGALDHLHLAREIRERSPNTRIRVLWHGNYLQSREDYAWRGLRLMTEMARREHVHAIGFVKEGMAELMTQQGVNAGFVLNYIDEIPEAPSNHAEGGPHLGMWISNEGWRKVPYAMAAGAARLPGANLHYNGVRKRLLEFSRLVGLKVQPHGDGLFGPDELRKWMRLMHVNLYVTLSECCPMVPLESLSVGTPCLVGANSHLFRDDRYLYDRLVVPFADSSESIYEKLLQAIDERDEIVEAYRAYAPGYIARARKSVDAFLAL